MPKIKTIDWKKRLVKGDRKDIIPFLPRDRQEALKLCIERTGDRSWCFKKLCPR